MYWYEEDIKNLEENSARLGYDPDTIFYGSSSIRMWTTLSDDFKGLKTINLGFGGSTLAACVYFFERLMKAYHPQRFIIYAGDNDLGDGRHAEEVLIFFQELMTKANTQFEKIPCYFISLKPSLARWQLIDEYKYANSLIETEIIKINNNWRYIDVFSKMLDASGRPVGEYYLDDGLHLSQKGYGLWAETVNKSITNSN